MTDVRNNIVKIARAAVKYPTFHYAQVRPIQFNWNAPSVKIDCSGFYTGCYRHAGAPDPNGPQYAYNGQGYTGTLMTNGKKIALKDVRPGDAVIYGAYPGEHVAIVVENDGKDPATVSMGQEGDPSYVRVSQDGRPHAYYTFDTTQKWKPIPFPGSKPAQAAHAAVAPVTNAVNNKKIHLSLGSQGADVKKVQAKVRVLVDGIYGDKTQAAVKKFQSENKLQVTGVVNNATWKALGL